MGFGGLNPFPFRFGGGPSNQLVIYRSLNEGLGTAFDTTDESTVTAETSADARAIAAVWSANARLANQMDPAKMTDFLGRWEDIFDLRPHRNDSDNARRAVVALKFLALSASLYGTIEEVAAAIMGSAYIDVLYADLVTGHSSWPGGTPSEPTMWTSSIAHVLVRVVRYDAIVGMTQHEFFDRLRQLKFFLRDYMAAWTTLDWAWDGSGGPGFYLDEDGNLDGEYFDS